MKKFKKSTSICTWIIKIKKILRSPNYYDVPLKTPVVVFIRKDGTRYYRLYNDLESQLGIDTNEEMAPKLNQYVAIENSKLSKEQHDNKETVIEWELLTTAHPNIQLKKILWR